MKMSDRKKKILQIVVDEYINTAVPVSSKSIAEKHFDKVAVHGDAELKELFGVAGRKPQAVMKSQSKVRDMDSGMER